MLTAQQAFERLKDYTELFYKEYAAFYSGDENLIKLAARPESFWKRSTNKCRIHVPIASDISSISADLLFSSAPKFQIREDAGLEEESPAQTRLEYILNSNLFVSRLNEAAESASALGDVYMKVNWDVELADYPMLNVVQADNAWPEYRYDILECLHFFSVLATDNSTVFRIHELYSKGEILTELFKGTAATLGTKMPEDALNEYGMLPYVTTGIDDILAVHIANIRPNRVTRSSRFGRSDYASSISLMDALDEAYSSWMRDIRLGKGKVIVPMEYLKKKPKMASNGGKGYSYEFDADVEAYVALDIDMAGRSSAGITTTQFEIRSAEHAATCLELMERIITNAGYSPQTYGLKIENRAESGAALRIREKRTFDTANKKEKYWEKSLEQLLTSVVSLDAKLFAGKGSKPGTSVNMTFADITATDLSATASTVDMMQRAAAISTKVKVEMLHPEWSQKMINEEVERIKDEIGLGLPTVEDAYLGDTEGEPEDEEEEYESGGR